MPFKICLNLVAIFIYCNYRFVNKQKTKQSTVAENRENR